MMLMAVGCVPCFGTCVDDSSLNSSEESKVTASISGSYGKSLSTSVSDRVNKDR